MVSVTRPDGTPIEGRIIGYRDGMRAIGGYCPDIALTTVDRPVGDAVAVRRPVRLNRVRNGSGLCELPFLTARVINDPELAIKGVPIRGILRTSKAENDGLAIRRPCGVVAEIGETADGLAGRTHHEN